MSETPERQTHTTGEVYVHPRGEGYRSEYCKTFGCRPFCGCGDLKKFAGDTPTTECEDECEGCQCLVKNSKKESDV